MNDNIEYSVSVILPTFNRYNYFVNAIESILNQTHQFLEIIIVNDGSTQEEYYSSKYREYENINWIDLDSKRKLSFESGPQNIASLRNLGIKLAKNNFIAFLDDDDLWFPDKLSIQLLAMQQKQIYFSCTEGYYGEGTYDENVKYKLYNKKKFKKELKKIYQNSNFKIPKKFPEVWTYDFLKIHNCVITSSVVVEASLLKKVEGFKPVNWAEDYDCWLRILEVSNILYIDQPLFYYDGKHGDGRLY